MWLIRLDEKVCWAGEMLDKYSDLTLVDYGFVYLRDINFPQDDTNWFLLEITV
ncbi:MULTISPECIES: hypothetical protein [Shewanella]|uniref:hypothetical protein n=1 Tax=Shewanella TaxID=22 RepID=UPI00235573A1|nr:MULTISPECIES: hypothetical protein [Shewanella]